MKPLNEYVYTHNTPLKTLLPISFVPKTIVRSHADADQQTRLGFVSVAQIRQHVGVTVSNYSQLVSHVAEIGFSNQQFNLLFRGQDADYRDRKQRSKIYPSIFRPEIGKSRVTETILGVRFDKLNEIRQALRKRRDDISLHKGLSGHVEYYYGLIQHYEICNTPLIDLTQSLHVAATLAMRKRNGFGVSPRN